MPGHTLIMFWDFHWKRVYQYPAGRGSYTYIAIKLLKGKTDRIHLIVNWLCEESEDYFFSCHKLYTAFQKGKLMVQLVKWTVGEGCDDPSHLQNECTLTWRKLSGSKKQMNCHLSHTSPLVDSMIWRDFMNFSSRWKQRPDVDFRKESAASFPAWKSVDIWLYFGIKNKLACHSMLLFRSRWWKWRNARVLPPLGLLAGLFLCF